MSFGFDKPRHLSADHAPRSPHWPFYRLAHLQQQPTCQWCGGRLALEVHHIQPFHLHPELELDPANLITLCELPGKQCHLVMGHLGDWKSFNASIVDCCHGHHAPAMPHAIEAPAPNPPAAVLAAVGLTLPTVPATTPISTATTPTVAVAANK